ncbi:FHA domain-containing protein [Microbacterium sp.]|uniref:FHA domain-containing protein n=1 Tax=Microbacterium sp. TaxID=51671 RepID=UPI00092BAE5E|nr:FHA domain-containing protein [Microbacterium sp.]MBN9192429.1 FHA domain-containing protein [Microbacterium sp.]OJU67284.1 MAG: hypothetical protein BGO04_03000 [Microbacterium sp. 70-38]
MVGIRYAPGSAHLVATRGAVVLIDAPISTELLTRIWSEVDEGRGLAAVLEALSGAFGTSLTSIPPFVVAVGEADGVRLAVRGDILVTVDGPGGVENITGTGVTTWSEQVVAAARMTVRIGQGPSTSPSVELPLRDGVVRAAALIADWTDAAAPRPASESRGVPFSGSAVDPSRPVPAVSGISVPSDPPVLRTVQGEPEPEPEPAAPAPGTAAAPEPAAAAPGAAAAPEPAAPEPAGPWSRRAAPALIDSSAVLTAGSADTWIPQDATLAPEPDEATIDDVPASATTGYDHLWGATVVRSVEDAAVRAVDDDGGGEVDGDEATPDAADHADTVASARERGDHDGETISVARARALRDAAGAATDLGDADSVPPLAPPRPAAPGRLLLSTGQLVPLDRTVVIGRRPRSTRVTGTDLPHLIAVASPEQDISRSHIEVRVEGDSILVTDLNTTNGTTLRRLGTDPVRIHPGERTVVVPGDVLDLGDGVTVTVEGIE